MRYDTAAFALLNKSPNKKPRYVIEQAFDFDNTDLHYFTSHTDAALPSGATATLDVVRSISGTSQTLSPDKGTNSIGNIQFDLIDPGSVIRDLFGNKLASAKVLRNKRSRIHVGFEDLAWADYTLVATQLARKINQKDGGYNLVCNDVQRQARKEIFDLFSTNLSQSIDASQLLIPVYSVTGIELNPHGTSYSDAPNQSVQYIHIEDEVIRCTGDIVDGTLGLSFVVDQDGRGALNTRAVEHTVDPEASPDRRKKVEEYIYLEMPAVKLIYALLTGILYGQGASLPASYHLGISTDYARLADFTGVGPDWWNPADDTEGFMARITGHKKTDGKKFIETQLYLLLGAYPPIYSDGAYGLRRMTGVLSDAAAVRVLTENEIVSYSDLSQDMEEVHNQVWINWSWDPIAENYSRHDLMLDANSLAVYKDAPIKELSFRTLSGYSHTFEMIGARFDALRDRFSAPPYRLDLTLTPDQNDIEVGDVVRVKLDQLDDYITKTTLDRAFEVQRVRLNWQTGLVNVSLFASTQSAGAIVRHSDSTVMDDAYYGSAGIELSGYLNANYPGSFTTIGDVGHIQADCTLPGNAVLSNGIYYYLGDLTIDAGVLVNITQNVMLTVMGFLTKNGEINGVGAGLSPGGGSGFIGATVAGGGISGLAYTTPGGPYFDTLSVIGQSDQGANNGAPQLTLVNQSTVLKGLPTDLRGVPGVAGGDIHLNNATHATGGAGGDGGAGLLIVARGMSFGAGGEINVSGSAGSDGGTYSRVVGTCTLSWSAGGGSPGHPGVVYFLIDGNGVTPTLSNVTADQPATPQAGTVLSSTGLLPINEACSIGLMHSYYTGTAFASRTNSIAKIQFIPKLETAEQDEQRYPPDITQFNAYQNGESSVLKWTAVKYDDDLGGYEIRYTPDTVNSFADGIPLTFETKGTNITTADLPPGDWRLYIVAVDRITGNKSVNAATTTLIVISSYDVIYEAEQAPGWLGTKTGFYKHHTGVLIPLSTRNADEVTFEEQFQQFVPYPVSESIYAAPEIDVAFNDTVRTWGNITSELGYGKTGTADPQLELDYRLDADAYDGFEPWSAGFVTARYFTHRLVQDNTNGVAVVQQFKPIVDALPKHDEGSNIDISIGGTVVLFNIEFHVAPIVETIINENSAKKAIAYNITTTQFTSRVFSLVEGSDVGGAINFKADGE